jgi:hypothetical protein
MKKTVIAVTIFTAMLSQKAQAQDFHHGIGAQILIGSHKLNDVREYFPAPAIMYKATLGFDLSENKFFAVSAYPCFGLNYQSNGYQSSTYIGYQLPILGEIYLGDIDDINFNAGLGFSYGSISYDESKNTVIGPVFNIGGQFYFRESLVGVRASYTLGLNKGVEVGSYSTQSPSMFGVGLYYLFGQ